MFILLREFYRWAKYNESLEQIAAMYEWLSTFFLIREWLSTYHHTYAMKLNGCSKNH